MNWVKAYLAAIDRGEEIVSQKVAAVYRRETGWIDNPPADFPFYFDEAEGERHIDFIEKFCRHSKGRFARQPFLLELFQKAKIQLVFGWRYKNTRIRRITEVVDIRGRKCGKSSETAAVEWSMLLNDGEYGAEIYCAANKRDQANLIYHEAVNMRLQSPELAAVTRKRQGDIYCPMFMSKIQSLSADSSTMDGLNASFFSLDEIHAAQTSAVYDVLKQSQSVREQPLAWLISTNGNVREGFFDDTYDYAAHVAMWDEGYQDYNLLPLIYELDSRDEWDKPEYWSKANPGLGKIKSVKFLTDGVELAKRKPSYLPTLLTKDFNLPESTASAWLPYQSIVNENVVEMEYLSNSYAVGGCDLSATTDLTCATLLIRKPGDDNYYVLQQYFLPKVRVDEVESSDKREAPYKTWADNGWLTLCESATVDYNAVTDWFVTMVKRYNIRPLWVCYDAALSGYWAPDMESKGFGLERIRQGPFTWSYPMKQLGGLFEEHKIIYQNNPILRWCLYNTGVKSTNKDGIESIQPVKASSRKRIDGLVSLLNAFVGYSNHTEDYLRRVR
ncbi:MAG TPA: terminase large subunit [Candidatus Omnitrophota bacterium]|nr:terminase large subunit [Candidatus Omnitrophota bacterium]